MRKEVVRMEHIEKSLNGVKVLNDFRMQILEGEIVGLLGLSGSGKSMVCRLLAKLEKPEGGRLLVDGREPLAHGNHKGYQGVYCLHQFISLVPQLTVADNIVLMNGKMFDPFIIRDQQTHLHATQILARVGLDIPPMTLIDDLTPMQQRLVEIAKGLKQGARLFVMDVVTDIYSQQDKQILHHTIQQLQKDGISFLVASHEPKELLELADRVVVLRTGQVIKTLYREEFDFNTIFSLLTGTPVESSTSHETKSSKDIVLEISGLRLSGIGPLSFHLREGELLGLLDVEGRINPKLYQFFCGNENALGGDVFLKNRRIDTRDVSETVRMGIGLVNQDCLEYGILPNLNFEQNLSLMILHKCTEELGILSRKTLRYLENQYWKRLNLPDTQKNDAVQTFHIHTQQLIMLLRWLVYRPKVLICLNPYAMMDSVTRHAVYHLLHEIAGQGTAVLILSSDIEEADSLCSRVLMYGSNVRTGLGSQR